MLTAISDLQRLGSSKNFETKLPKSFLGILVSSMAKLGVEVTNIIDLGDTRIRVCTSHGNIVMIGTWSVDDFKRKLYLEKCRENNERFDQRVEYLKSKGFQYYKQHTCFAKSEKGAIIGSCIPNATIMHADDFMFNMAIERVW